MTDATRDAAIQWAITNQCDFITPVFPPPEGWTWIKGEPWLHLYYHSMAPEEYEDIWLSDVTRWKTERRLHVTLEVPCIGVVHVK